MKFCAIHHKYGDCPYCKNNDLEYRGNRMAEALRTFVENYSVGFDPPQQMYDAAREALKQWEEK